MFDLKFMNVADLLLATGKLPELKGELNLVIYEFHNDKL